MNRPTLTPRIKAAGISEDRRTLEQALSDALTGRSIKEARGGRFRISAEHAGHRRDTDTTLNGKNPRNFT